MKGAAYVGLVLGLVGAALDFASGNSMVLMMSAPNSMVGVPSTSIGLYLLGAILVVAAALSVLPRMSGEMRKLGLLMEVLGVVMVVVGYWVPGMNIVLSYSMLVVGAAMILNGIFMQRTKRNMGSM